MWTGMTHLKIDSARLDEAMAFYNSEEVSGFARRQKDCCSHYLLESVDAPGEPVSLTPWDSRTDAEAFEQSEAYAAALSKLGRYLIARSERKTYEVRGQPRGRTRVGTSNNVNLPGKFDE